MHTSITTWDICPCTFEVLLITLKSAILKIMRQCIRCDDIRPTFNTTVM